MKMFSRVFRFYINASIHVAFAVVALLGVTVLAFGLKIPQALWMFVFFGTISGYNFVKYAKVAGLHHRSLAQNLRSIQVFSAVCLAAFFFSMFYIKIETLLVTTVFGFLTFFYAVPLFRNKNLRNISSFKIVVVAMVWTGVTVAVPVVEDGMKLTTDFWMSLIQRFLLVLVLIIPFEIRDLKFDNTHLQTLPQRLGTRVTKIVGAILLVVILLLEGFRNLIEYAHLYSLTSIVIVTGFLLRFARKKQSEYFASFWVESIPMVWILLFYLFRHFLT